MSTPISSADDLSDLQNIKSSLVSDMQTVENKVAGLYTVINGYAASYNSCVDSTKVENPTITIESCSIWLEKQSAVKSDITSLTTLMAALKAKLAAVESAIAKYQNSTTPSTPTYSYNDRAAFDSAVTAYYTKYVGDVRMAYKANGIPEEFTNAVPSPPGFSGSIDGTNDAAINEMANRLYKWWEAEQAALKAKIIARASSSTPSSSPTYYYNNQTAFNDALNGIYAKYVNDIKNQLKSAGAPNVTLETVPTAPTFSNTSDGTNDTAINAYISTFQAWHAKATAIIKAASGNTSGSGISGNQYDDKGVFEEQVGHYYDKYVNGAFDWMARLGVTGGFLISPPVKPAWTNTTDGTNDRLVNSFISQMSIWWQAQNDRLQPLQDKYDAEHQVYPYNDLSSFTDYKNAIIQKFVGGILAPYKALGIEYPTQRNSGIPTPPNFVDGRTDGVNQANLQAFVNTMSAWYMAEISVLNEVKLKLGITTVADPNISACGTLYEKIKGTYINTEYQTGNLELMISNLENFALKSKALGLTNQSGLENYWFGQLGNLKMAIYGGLNFTVDQQNSQFKSICVNHPQYTDLNNSVTILIKRYDELTARYNSLSIAMQKAISYSLSNILENDPNKSTNYERNAACLNTYNGLANEINSRMLDLLQIQDLLKQKMPIQMWVTKYPASSWSQVLNNLSSVLNGVSSAISGYRQLLSSDGKITYLCTGTDSGSSVLSKLNTLTDSLVKLQVETSDLLKTNWGQISTKPWDATTNSVQTEKICSEFYSAFNPAVTALATELARLRAITGKLSGTDTPENAYFVANTQQLLIQLKNSAWALYDKMKQSSGNISGCPYNGDLFSSTNKIADSAQSEYDAFTAKWNNMKSSSNEIPLECTKYLTYYQQRAAGYIDLFRMYADSWKSRETILEYVTANQVQTWQAVFEIFMNKTNGLANIVASDKNEIANSKIQAICSGYKDGDQYLAKTLSLYANPGPLTYIQDSTFMAIKNAFVVYSKVPFGALSTPELSQEQACHSMEGYYSQLSNSLILSLQNLGSLWNNMDSALLYQKNNGISFTASYAQAQSQMKQIYSAMNAAVAELKAGKLAGICKGLSFSNDYQMKIDSLFNPSSGSVFYWYSITNKSIQDTYSSYQSSLDRPAKESDAYCKNFSVENLKTISTIRSNIASIRDKFKFTLTASELSDSTKNLSYQNMGAALLDLQNSLLEMVSKLQEYQKNTKCAQVAELLKQTSAAIVELKDVQSSISSVGWKVDTSQSHAVSTIVNAEKTIGGDSKLAEVATIEERPTVTDQVKASVITPKQTSIQIATNYPNTKLTVVAKKANSSRKITYTVTTSSIGTAALKVSSNLKGYQVTIYVGDIAISKTSA